MNTFLGISIILSITGGAYFLYRAINRLCSRIDRLAAAWEKDDEDDGDSWKKEKA